MAKFHLISVFSGASGKLCGTEKVHLRQNRQTGQTYAVEVHNPYDGPATEKQMAQRKAFGDKTKLVAAWLAANRPNDQRPKGTELYQRVHAAYKSQHKVGSISAFVRTKMDADGNLTIATDTDLPTGGGGTNRQYTITATSADTTQGTVTGGGTFSEGSRITLTATAKSGYTFDRWSDGVTTASRTVNVSQNLTLTATFRTAEPGDDNQQEDFI